MPKIEESAIWDEMQKEKPFVTMFAFSWQPINGQGVDLRVTPHGVTVSVSRRVNRRKRGVRLTPSVLYSASGDPTYSFGLAGVFESYFDFLHFLTDKACIQEWGEWVLNRREQKSEDDEDEWEIEDVGNSVHWDLRLYSPLYEEEQICISDESEEEFPPGFDELLSVVNEWLELIGIPITLY